MTPMKKMKKKWNDPSPDRQKRNRQALAYAALTLGSLLIVLLTFGIARVAGIPVKSVQYIALPFACLFVCLLFCLPPFAIWMVRQSRREKAWKWHQARLGEVLLMERLAQGKGAGAKRLTAEQVNEMDRDWERGRAQLEHRSNGKIALAGLAVGLIALPIWMILNKSGKSGIALIALVPMLLGLGGALLYGLIWLMERSTLRRDQKEREFLKRGGSFEELRRRRNRKDARLLAAVWIAALALFLLNLHFRSQGNETATQLTNFGLLAVLFPAVPATFVTIEFALKDRRDRRKREQQVEEVRSVEDAYNRNAGERWVTALAGTVEKPVESRVDLARQGDGWVVRETRAERGGPFAHVVRTTSHRLAKAYFTNHSAEDFRAQLSRWFPGWSFDGVPNDPVVRGLLAGKEPKTSLTDGVEWIERFYSENTGSTLYPVDLVRVGGAYFIRDGSLSLEGDGEWGVYTCNRLGARYFREHTVEDLIGDVETDVLFESRRRIASAEKQRLQESPRLRALFEGARSIPADGLCRWLTLRLHAAAGVDSPEVEAYLFERASGWTLADGMKLNDARKLDLPADCFALDALPRTLERAGAAFSKLNGEQTRAALAAALSVLGEAEGEATELFTWNSEARGGVSAENLDLYSDPSGGLFLRRRRRMRGLLPWGDIDVLPLPEDYFRTHGMEEFIETACGLCHWIDEEALRRNPALQALFGEVQPNPESQPGS